MSFVLVYKLLDILLQPRSVGRNCQHDSCLVDPGDRNDLLDPHSHEHQHNSHQVGCPRIFKVWTFYLYSGDPIWISDTWHLNTGFGYFLLIMMPKAFEYLSILRCHPNSEPFLVWYLDYCNDIRKICDKITPSEIWAQDLSRTSNTRGTGMVY